MHGVSVWLVQGREPSTGVAWSQLLKTNLPRAETLIPHHTVLLCSFYCGLANALVSFQWKSTLQNGAVALVVLLQHLPLFYFSVSSGTLFSLVILAKHE